MCIYSQIHSCTHMYPHAAPTHTQLSTYTLSSTCTIHTRSFILSSIHTHIHTHTHAIHFLTHTHTTYLHTVIHSYTCIIHTHPSSFSHPHTLTYTHTHATIHFFTLTPPTHMHTHSHPHKHTQTQNSHTTYPHTLSPSCTHTHPPLQPWTDLCQAGARLDGAGQFQAPTFGWGANWVTRGSASSLCLSFPSCPSPTWAAQGC